MQKITKKRSEKLLLKIESPVQWTHRIELGAAAELNSAEGP